MRVTQGSEYGAGALPQAIGNLQGRQLDEFHRIRSEQKAGRATEAHVMSGYEIRLAYKQAKSVLP